MRQITGFTLIELTLTLSLLGILALAAIPYYQVPIAVTHRLAAKTRLYQLANDLESYHTAHDSYNGFVLAIHDDGHYLYQLKSTDTTYVISAVPRGTELGNAITLDQEGRFDE